MNYLTFKLIYTAFKLFLFMSYFNMGYIYIHTFQYTEYKLVFSNYLKYHSHSSQSSHG